MLGSLGSILVIMSAGLAGYIMSRRSVTRFQLLLELDKALGMLRSEIDYSSNTLEEAFEGIAKKTAGGVSELFTACASGLESEGVFAADVWRNAVVSALGGYGFTDIDMETFGGFGRDLGSIDPRSQRDGIAQLRAYISRRSNELNDEMKKDRRIYMTIGLSVGLMAAIVLI